jgi:hypothetical protein
MDWADCGIARELRPRLKSRLPGIMLASPRRAKSDKHLDKGNPVGNDFHFGMVGLPKLGVKGVCTRCAFSNEGRKVKATGSPRPSGGVRIEVPVPIEVLR